MSNLQEIKNKLDSLTLKYLKNYNLKFPSYNYIEDYANTLYEIIKKYKSDNSENKVDFITEIHLADILKVDLKKTLYYDEKKKLVRYKEKWNEYHKKLDKLKYNFLDKAEKNLE